LEQDEETLKQSDNPFALAVLAGLYVIKSKRNVEQKLAYKLSLIRLMLGKGYGREQIEKLFIFIDDMLELPKEEGLKFEEEVKRILKKEGDSMGLTWDNSNLAKIYKEIGREEGIAEGIKKGIENGKAELIIRLLQKKFGTLSEDYIEKIKKQDDAVLDAIADNIFEISDIGQLNDYLV